jgi:ATP-dependent protease HslVU (ClpYQ) peptidase subunit
MTCIVGLVEDGLIYMAGDSAAVASSSYDRYKRKDPKVFINGSFIFGYTGSFRMGQLLRFSFRPPSLPSGMDIYEYMCTSFVDEIRKCFKDGGFMKIENSVEESEAAFLVGYKGRLFFVDSDLHIGEPIFNYDACGCGKYYALGSLYASQDIDPPQTRLMIALSAAQEFCGGVSEPFVIECLENN